MSCRHLCKLYLNDHCHLFIDLGGMRNDDSAEAMIAECARHRLKTIQVLLLPLARRRARNSLRPPSARPSARPVRGSVRPAFRPSVRSLWRDSETDLMCKNADGLARTLQS